MKSTNDSFTSTEPSWDFYITKYTVVFQLIHLPRIPLTPTVIRISGFANSICIHAGQVIFILAENVDSAVHCFGIVAVLRQQLGNTLVDRRSMTRSTSAVALTRSIALACS